MNPSFGWYVAGVLLALAATIIFVTDGSTIGAAATGTLLGWNVRAAVDQWVHAPQRPR